MFKRKPLFNGLIAIATSLILLAAPLIGIAERKPKDKRKSRPTEILENINIEGELIGKFASETKLRISKNIEENNKAQEIAKQISMEETAVSISRGGLAPKNSKGIMPLVGALSSTYGPRWGRQHKGIDIAASTGENVVAFLPGRVEFSGWNCGGYGYLVIINHGNGVESYYAHNSKLLVKEGQYVDQGEHISEVGSTGNSTGPHLHFEVRINGVSENPTKYIR